MKKFFCLVLVVLATFLFVGCVPTYVETQEQKEMKQKLKEEQQELEEILSKSVEQDTKKVEN